MSCGSQCRSSKEVEESRDGTLQLTKDMELHTSSVFTKDLFSISGHGAGRKRRGGGAATVGGGGGGWGWRARRKDKRVGR
ncbi:unnamed protein product [Musa banksii]